MAAGARGPSFEARREERRAPQDDGGVYKWWARREERLLPTLQSSPLRGLYQPRLEMFQPRHHFLAQQPQRVLPRLGLVLVVEAEHQQRAESADLVIDPFDLLG